ncbi:MAG: urea ABC transporter ATP-binding protein UrtD [Deltaproteobacteria bacterium]|jgi:urea transport system ATP-binding protein|nr:urea ABC transporter ATP-binding protein UrtD [Deltaproteobacteria bacterium]MCL6119960.1 urea ABC transporter ATP-binding protein UrtD [Deltaproteobacteria bacterium]
MAGTILYGENITVDFNGFKALNGVSLYVDERELRFLIGPNGAGKTTLLDVICGKVRPVSGSITFEENIELLGLKEYQRARIGVARKFQTPSIFEQLTVIENMIIAHKKNKGVFSSIFNKIDRKSENDIYEVMEKINLIDKKLQYAGLLSHGEKQWLEIGMTMLQSPKLLLVDEPVAGMTGMERDKTGELLKSLAKDMSVLIVEHDMNFVEKFGERVTVLHEGSILCEGSFEYVRNDQTVIDVYLGRGVEEDA